MPKLQTAASRAAEVKGAATAIPILVATAERVSAGKPPSHPAVIAAWSEVERAFAVGHRRSRFLAGKGKGG